MAIRYYFIAIINYPTDAMIGDSFCVISDPDKEVGYLTQNAISGDNVIHVNPESLASLQRGIDVSIANGVKKQDLGAILSINTFNNTITVEDLVDTNFYTTSGTVKLLYNYCMIKDRYIENTKQLIFGAKGFKGKELPIGMKLRVRYQNMNGQPKTFYWNSEYYIQ